MEARPGEEKESIESQRRIVSGRHLVKHHFYHQDRKDKVMRTIKTPAIHVAPVTEVAAETTEATTDNATTEETTTATGETAEQAAEATTMEADDNIIDDEPSQEIELLNTIYKATVKAINLAREVASVRAQLDEMQSELAAANDLRDSLVNELPETLLKLRDGVSVVPVAKVAASVVSSEAAEPEPFNGDWQSLDTSEIIKGIEGLGPKKIDAIIQQAPTLGKLMAVLITARSERKHFSACLPKGVGKGSADELESRLLAAQTAGDTRPASEVVEPRVEKTTEPAAQASSPDIKHEQWVRAMASSMRANAADGSLDSETDSDTWDEGYQEFGLGSSITRCPIGYTDAAKLDWIRGWLAGEMMGSDVSDLASTAIAAADEVADDEPESIERETVDSVEEYEDISDDEDASSDEATPAEFVEVLVDEKAPALTLQFLETLAESIKGTGNTKAHSDESAWNLGYESGIDELPLESCPSGLTTGGVGDWVRGWIEGSSIGAGI